MRSSDQQLKKNRTIYIIWLVLLLALEYCGIRSTAPLIVIPPLVLLVLIVLTQRRFVCWLFYAWMVLTIFMGIWAGRSELYTAQRFYHIGCCIFSALLGVSVAVWTFQQRSK